jgi:competence protein ComGC
LKQIKIVNIFKLLLFFSVIIVIVIFLLINSTSLTKHSGIKHISKSIQQQTTGYFISDYEPTTKDALWTQDGVFKVGVLNDGTSRDGYAQYVCEVLRSDFGIDSKVLIRVIDVMQVQNSNWVNLGSAYCNY